MTDRQATAEPTYPTLAAACDYLRRQGYRVGKSKLSADTRRGMIGRTADGAYTQTALDRYGAAHCRPLVGVDDAEADDHWQRLLRKSRALEAEQRARERELRVRRLEGELIDRARVERELAARAMVLRADYEAWCHESAVTLAEQFEVEAHRVPELQQALIDAGQDWFDRYADPSDFVAYLPPRTDDETEP